MKRVLVVAVVAALATLCGCKVQTTLNDKCNLVRKDDAGTVIPLTEREVQQKTGAGQTATSTRDFLAFGAVECEDSVCVRDSSFPQKDNSDGGANLDVPAEGYCSKLCDVGLECPSNDSALDNNPKTRLSCRALLLDRATLNALSMSGLGNTVGSAKEPYFCARGGLGDAGI